MATVFVTPAAGLDVPNPDMGPGVLFSPSGETVELTDYVQRRIDDGDLVVSTPAGPDWRDVVITDADTLSYDPITVASGQGVLYAGAVLGKVTASGKFVLSPDTGSDGSQVASAVLRYPIDATSGDAVTQAMTCLGEVKKAKLSYAGSVNDNTKKAAKQTQLLAAFIKAR